MATLGRGLSNDVFFQIGMITTMGLAAKNAILIVEFARELYEKEGRSLFDAAVVAARMRLRPIIMTSLAFVMGGSEEHTSELQSLMRISYAVFCLKKKNKIKTKNKWTQRHN